MEAVFLGVAHLLAVGTLWPISPGSVGTGRSIVSLHGTPTDRVDGWGRRGGLLARVRGLRTAQEGFHCIHGVEVLHQRLPIHPEFLGGSKDSVRCRSPLQCRGSQSIYEAVDQGPFPHVLDLNLPHWEDDAHRIGCDSPHPQSVVRDGLAHGLSNFPQSLNGMSVGHLAGSQFLDESGDKSFHRGRGAPFVQLPSEWGD